MVPVKLSLQNFLSYGEGVPSLDFTKFHLACLSGDNGHGKSALLDAITWAIWGEARKAPSDKKPDDGLLRIGAKEMSVEFEFEVEGDLFRIIRNYRKSSRGSGQSSLELQVFDKAYDMYRSLTQTSMKATEEKIVDILGMDYETFINSAFILQGRADEFTKKTARERKNILAEILGLSKYDELARLARQHYNETERLLSAYNFKLEGIDAELANTGLYREKIVQLSEDLDKISERISSDEKVLSELRQRRIELLNISHQISEIEQRIEQLSGEIQEDEDQISKLEQEIKEYEGILTQKTAILNDFEIFQKLSEENRSFMEKLQKLRDAEKDRSDLEQRIQSLRHQLETTLRELKTKLSQAETTLQESQEVIAKENEVSEGYKALLIARDEDEAWEERRNRKEELEHKVRDVQKVLDSARLEIEMSLKTLSAQYKEQKTKVDALPGLRKILDEAQNKLKRLEELSLEKERVRERGSATRLEIDKLKNQIQLIKDGIIETEKKIELLSKSLEAQCPLCETHLDEQTKDNILKKMNMEIEESHRIIGELDGKVKTAETKRTELIARYKEIEDGLKTLPEAQRNAAQAESAYREAEEIAKKIVELEKEGVTLRRKLEEGNYALDERKTLSQLQDTVEQIGYDRNKHIEVKDSVKRLQKFEAEKIKLDSARTQAEKAGQTIPDLTDEIERIQKQLEDREYAETEQIELERIKGWIRDIGYDEEAHRKVQSELKSLGDPSLRKEKLTVAEARIGQIRESLAKTRENRVKKIEAQTDLKSRMSDLSKEVEKLPETEVGISRIEGQLVYTQEAKDKLLQERGIFQGKLQNCLKLEEEKKRISDGVVSYQKEKLLYEKLTTAFGKDGIQALIIESAIPEIEEEANRILARLTDNRTHISIEPLRDLKDGGVKETLDIRISDEMGTRDYAFFSGGEAFRTDFSIRIALSKLLAKRAGTRLRTLVIDEGFGTQDSQGIDYLVEAIQSISEDFDKILIITHLNALKDAFPVRIHVTKLPDIGSRFEVIS